MFYSQSLEIFKELIARKFIIFSKLIARKFIFMVNCKGFFLGLQAWQLQDVIVKREQLGKTVYVRFSVGTSVNCDDLNLAINIVII